VQQQFFVNQAIGIQVPPDDAQAIAHGI
jgi:hypothetical protein